MSDGERIGNVNVTGGDFVGRDKVTNIYPPGSAPAELTPEQLDAAEKRYRAQVIERYKSLFKYYWLLRLPPPDFPGIPDRPPHCCPARPGLYRFGDGRSAQGLVAGGASAGDWATCILR